MDDRQFGALIQRSTVNGARVGRHAAPLLCILRRRQRLVCTYIRTAFVDFAKAFDHVDHNVLVAKLVSLGLPDVIVRWMCAFLRQQQQRED